MSSFFSVGNNPESWLARGLAQDPELLADELRILAQVGTDVGPNTVDLLDRVRAFLGATAVWRPIETAPTSGEPVIGLSEPEGVAYVCWADSRTVETGIWRFFVSARFNLGFNPTHWKPLRLPAQVAPNPPEGAGK